LAAMAKLSDFTSQELANTLNALAKFDHYEKGLVDALCSIAMNKTGEFNSQGITNSLYALTILAHYDDSIWYFFFDELSMLFNLNAEALNTEEHSQIHLILLALSVENPTLFSKLQFPLALKEKSSNAHVAQMSSSKSSKLHLSVSHTLNEMSISHENEFFASGFLSVDIFIKPNIPQQQQQQQISGDTPPPPNNGLIIEVDGPCHYLRCGTESEMIGVRSSTVKGEHVLKKRLLEKQGYNLLNIPYYEWDKLDDEESKKDYLRKKCDLGHIHTVKK
jgi:hypothetical protein